MTEDKVTLIQWCGCYIITSLKGSNLDRTSIGMATREEILEIAKDTIPAMKKFIKMYEELNEVT